MPAWYTGLMNSFIIPIAEPFGYVHETSEILAGVALIAGPLIWLFAWGRVSHRLRLAVFLSMAVAAIGGTFLAINLHLANGASHPWLIPGDAFDEGIDLDSVLPAIQIVIAAVSIVLFRRYRRGSTEVRSATSSPPNPGTTTDRGTQAMTYQSVNPYDGNFLKTFEEHTDDQLETAIGTAEGCFQAWRGKTFPERAAIIGKVAELMDARVGELARLLTAHLAAMNAAGPHPWMLSFSFSRAIQDPVLETWRGDAANVAAAHAAFAERARQNGLAQEGKLD